jgi:oxygen-independent coproporphyrinogen III oxidase
MFGLYIHIPYCLQRCRYCDFATYVHDQILPPEDYVLLLKKELWAKTRLFPSKKLRSIYFGGGTPSLLETSLILTLLGEIAKCGLEISEETEITLEINPATLERNKITQLIEGGINRFSVGAQTFNDRLLEDAGRKHSSQDTRQTLDLLAERGINYSFDLLFALPNQTVEMLEEDLKIIKTYSPPHLSAYCLTVPEGHPMSFQRASDERQVEMFQRIEDRLKSESIFRYEISNFAKKGFESKHNLLYWRDDNYLGIGLSAHSYLKNKATWGVRFWNPASIEKYQETVVSLTGDPLEALEAIGHLETPSEKDSLFDFCHTSLRLEEGLSEDTLLKKFSGVSLRPVFTELEKMKQGELLIRRDSGHWALTEKGRHMSNFVFSCLR